jgi:hypothetical protein
MAAALDLFAGNNPWSRALRAYALSQQLGVLLFTVGVQGEQGAWEAMQSGCRPSGALHLGLLSTHCTMRFH